MYIPKINNIKDNEESMKIFIDFDKTENQLYDNLYLSEFDVVIKTPMVKKDSPSSKIRFEYFSLANDTFLVSY